MLYWESHTASDGISFITLHCSCNYSTTSLGSSVLSFTEEVRTELRIASRLSRLLNDCAAQLSLSRGSSAYVYSTNRGDPSLGGTSFLAPV